MIGTKTTIVAIANRLYLHRKSVLLVLAVHASGEAGNE
jgi:hypothetical protein